MYLNTSTFHTYNTLMESMWIYNALHVDIQCINIPCTQVHVVLVEHSSHENANTLKITTLHVIGSQVLP